MGLSMRYPVSYFAFTQQNNTLFELRNDDRQYQVVSASVFPAMAVVCRCSDCRRGTFPPEAAQLIGLQQSNEVDVTVMCP